MIDLELSPQEIASRTAHPQWYYRFVDTRQVIVSSEDPTDLERQAQELGLHERDDVELIRPHYLQCGEPIRGEFMEAVTELLAAQRRLNTASKNAKIAKCRRRVAKAKLALTELRAKYGVDG